MLKVKYFYQVSFLNKNITLYPHLCELTAVLVENRGRSVSWILEMWAPAGIWLPKTTATSSPKLTASRNQEAENHTS